MFGRIVDRCGQTATLICTAVGSALLLIAVATLSPSAATAVALAAAIGLFAPPVDACARALLPAVVGRQEFSVPPAWAVTALGALVFATVAVSGIDYVLIYGRRAFSRSVPRAAGRAGDRPP